jgi:hypothetical protein
VDLSSGSVGEGVGDRIGTPEPVPNAKTYTQDPEKNVLVPIIGGGRWRRPPANG